MTNKEPFDLEELFRRLAESGDGQGFRQADYWARLLIPELEKLIDERIEKALGKAIIKLTEEKNHG